MPKKYTYLVKRKTDNKLFVMYGNFKFAGLRPVYLFEFAPETYEYKFKTPFGDVMNVSSSLRYNSKEYSVVRQALLA